MNLGVNIDHVATLREARKEQVPNILQAADLAYAGGATSITVHLREDRRHIQDEDVIQLRKSKKFKLNLEMAATAFMIKFATRIGPDQVTLVPEKRQELTTEGGLHLRKLWKRLRQSVQTLHRAKLKVSLFINPELEILPIAKQIQADAVELHTGLYSLSFKQEHKQGSTPHALNQIKICALLAYQMGFQVNAGHGLTYQNVGQVARIAEIQELNIGHDIVARAVLVGMKQAVHEMVQEIRRK
jgi:pyridoxine 5-phosphate synthase